LVILFGVIITMPKRKQILEPIGLT
jgi:hypothetical protein